MDDQTENITNIIKHLNFLNECLLKMWADEKKILNILRQNQANWNYLTKELRKLIEDFDGLHSYVTSNLSKKIESHISTTVGKKNKYY